MIKDSSLYFNNVAFNIQTSPTAFDGANKTVTLCEGKVTESTGFGNGDSALSDLIESVVVWQWGSSATGIYFIKVI